ncbi:helix-turn-helix domain-containing protein [Streptomyces hydrogenans]
MHNEQGAGMRAAVELGRRLDEGRSRAGLNQTQLAKRAGLARATVNQALSPRGPVPSVDTVTALSRVLKLRLDELLRLQRDAKEAENPDTASGAGAGAPGRPIGQWEPHELEVHPAGSGTDVSGPGVPGLLSLPGYVPRRHDRVLADAVRDAVAGRSRIVVLVGTSSTGKTRACWEAVQPLAEQGWRLWHPFDPTRAEAALAELGRVEPRTVVWLNEAQHYLGDRAVGERISAAVHRLVVEKERGPVLVLGTLWPEYAHQYAAMPQPNGSDPHSRARELLARCTQTVPDSFDTEALAFAAVLAEQGDRLLADALTRAREGGRVTQDLAGAPELLRRFEQATPPARALLEAAMDARRLGMGLHLPQAFLTDAASDYLSQHDYDHLTDDWAELAYAELAQPVHGKQAPMRRTSLRPPRRPPAPSADVGAPVSASAGPVVLLADYLEQHGRITRSLLCPPASWWDAAHTHLTRVEDLRTLAQAAEDRHRLQWAHYLRHRALVLGDTTVLGLLAVAREEAEDGEGAEAFAQQAADRGGASVLAQLAEFRERIGNRAGSEALAQKAAHHGHPAVLIRLAQLRGEAGDRVGAEALAQQAAQLGDSSALAQLRWENAYREGDERVLWEAAEHGRPSALVRLAVLREQAGDRDGAEALAKQGVTHGTTIVLTRLAELREEAGDSESAEALAGEAAVHGSTYTLVHLAGIREKSGDWKGAARLLQQAVDRSDPIGRIRLAELQERMGERDSAESLARQVAFRGRPDALLCLARLRKDSGNLPAAERLFRQAGGGIALTQLAEMRQEAGDDTGVDRLLQHAADIGETVAMLRLAVMREEAGDRGGAEVLAQLAADRGDTIPMTKLAAMREEAGDMEGAETLAHRAFAQGDSSILVRLILNRTTTGDWERVENLARHAADSGHPSRRSGLILPTDLRKDVFLRLWPNGLDPDGTPTPPWQPFIAGTPS